ncbi:Kae1-associated serine/threonine protein kinase [Candidatus Woesearchaeota archaeon]|nr:Kae1-associated serine/threonine protein kinase [Candidatus Woesearchaeota archaeon]
MAKITREKFKTWGNVFDNFTIRLLFELSSKGHFDELKSPVSIGKEANIFTAEKEDGNLIIIKIFRLENCEFNKMYDYIKYDERYIHLKTKRREIIFAWAQREYRNLLKSREAGVRVPLPYQCKKHIILMEMIGENEPAPKLKDCIPKNPEEFMEKTVEYMKKLHKAGIVHGDLSEFNILNCKEQPVFIDISQGTTTKSINARELLERDVKNICRFMKKIGVEKEKEEIMKKITND